MPCKTVQFKDGSTAIVCGRSNRPKPCVGCGKPATLLCDGIVSGGYPPHAVQTCDAPICVSCATHIRPNKDLCPACCARARTLETR